MPRFFSSTIRDDSVDAQANTPGSNQRYRRTSFHRQSLSTIDARGNDDYVQRAQPPQKFRIRVFATPSMALFIASSFKSGADRMADNDTSVLLSSNIQGNDLSICDISRFDLTEPVLFLACIIFIPLDQ